MTDALFYAVYRGLHHRLLYPLHKQHHVWHSHIGMAALDAGVTECLFLNVLPVVFAARVVGMTPAHMCAWIAVASYNTVLSHARPGRHVGHHRNPNTNYGVGFYVMDRVCGTGGVT